MSKGRFATRACASALTLLFVLGCAAEKEELRTVEADRETAARLISRGAELVADYGSFQLLRADEQTLEGEEVESRDEYGQILLHAGAIETATWLQDATPPKEGARLYLIQFAGPIQPAWYRALEQTEARLVTYIPSNSYLVYADASSFGRLQELAQNHPAVRFFSDYLDDYKVHPQVYAFSGSRWAFQLVEDAGSNDLTVAMINASATGQVIVQEALGYRNVVAEMPRAEALALATRPELVSLLPRPTPRKWGERAALLAAGIPVGSTGSPLTYFDWLAQKGFTQAQFDQSGFGVDVTDSGLDDGTIAPNHFGLYRRGDVRDVSRIVYNRLEGYPNSRSTILGCDGHGTINAHIIGGYASRTGSHHVDAAGYRYGLGVAPFVRMGASVIFDPDTFTEPDYEDLISRAYRDGMRISSNSWGSDANLYDVDAQRYDGLVRDAQPAGSAVAAGGDQEMVIVFAAGNDGPGSRTLGSPATGKNVIAVGAAENVNPTGGDGCGTPDSEANSILDIASFSSRGPTSDGRTKPDLLAAGTHVSGGVAQTEGQLNDPPAYPQGDAIPCFDGDGVCGSRSSAFDPAGQEWYTTSTGTSHSTPVVAGAAALLRQYFLNQGLPPPSPAMTKAYLVASARYMTGTYANDTLPSNHQGMGLVDMGAAFDGVGRILSDQESARLFTTSGQVRTFSGEVGDSSQPFRVTLAWTDVPGSTSGSAWRNDLDLRVTVGGTTYKGNVFSGDLSIAGGSADSRNNVESVFLPAGTQGPFTIEVIASNINSPALSSITGPNQDFALVASNTCGRAAEAVRAVRASAPSDNTIEIDWDPNGAVSYRIYRAADPAGPWERIGEVVEPPFVDAGVSGSTTWHYVVRAVDCSESPDSPIASATATGACLLLPTFDGIRQVENAARSTCTTAIEWQPARPACGGALTYSIYRSTAPDFAPSAANRIATGLTGTSFSDAGGLESGATYHYVVRATESADGSLEESNVVRLAARTSGPITEGLRFFDGFDGAAIDGRWSTSATVGSAASLQRVDGCRYHSPTGALRFGATDTQCGGAYENNQQLLLALGGADGFTIPADAEDAELSFRLWYDLENRYDGAWLVFSLSSADGPWLEVEEAPTGLHPWIVEGGYDDSLTSNRDIRIWTGSNGAFQQVRVNVDALAGEQVWFGFRFYSGSREVAEGLYLDDVRLVADRVASCTPGLPSEKPAVAYAIASVPQAADAGATVYLDLRAIDKNGDLAIDYAGTAAVSSSDGAASHPESIAFSGGVAQLPITFRTAGAQSVTLRDAAAGLETTASLEIRANALIALALRGMPAELEAGEFFEVQVEMVDAAGNPRGKGEGLVTLTLGGPAAQLVGETSKQLVNGAASFDLSVEKAGSGYLLRAAVGNLTASSAPFAVDPGAASLFEVILPAAAQAGIEIHARALVIDDYGNRAPYAGPVTLTSSDPLAILPAESAFAAGEWTGALTFRTGGSQELILTAPDRHPQGSATIEIAPFVAPTVEIVGPAEGAVVSGEVRIVAAATVDRQSAVKELSILVDGETIATGLQANLSALWRSGTAAPGSVHVITAVVEDDAGQRVTSAPVQIQLAQKEPTSKKKKSSGCSAAGGEMGLFGLLALLALRRR